MIHKIDLKQEDQLFFLGDYIDRGNDSRKVIDFIIDLSNQYQIFPLKGNHEKDFEVMVKIKSERLFEQYLQKQPNSILNGDFSVNRKYTDFIKLLPYFYELENHFLVHAGFDFNQENHFKNTEEMLSIRNWDYELTAMLPIFV